MQAIARMQAEQHEYDNGPRRRKRARPPAEYMRARNVARIFPLSERKIEAMAGRLGGFKLTGCNVWFFRKDVLRAQIRSLAAANQEHIHPGGLIWRVSQGVSQEGRKSLYGAPDQYGHEGLICQSRQGVGGGDEIFRRRSLSM